MKNLVRHFLFTFLIIIHPTALFALSPFSGITVKESREVPGAKIVEIDSGSPAHLSGIKIGDIIVAIEGEKVNTLEDYIKISRGLKNKDIISLSLNRKGETIEVVLSVKTKDIPAQGRSSTLEKTEPVKDTRDSPRKSIPVEYEALLTIRQKSLLQNVNMDEAFFHLAKGQYLTSKAPEKKSTSDEFFRAVELVPNQADVWIHKGDYLTAIESRYSAISAYERAITIDPNSTKALLRKADILLTLSDYEEKNGKLYITSGYELVSKTRMKRKTEAYEICNKVISLNPRCAEAYAIAGLTLKTRSRHSGSKYDEKAAAYFKKAHVLDKRYRYNYYPDWTPPAITHMDFPERFEQHCRKSNYWRENALITFAQLICRNDIYARQIPWRISITPEIEDKTFIKKVYEEALQRCPNNATIWMWKGENHWQQEEYAKAMVAYVKAEDLSPSIVDFKEKGDFLFKEGNYDQSLKYYEIVLEANSEDTDYLRRMGDMAMELNRYSYALELYERVLKLRPKDVSSWTKKADILWSTEEYEESIKAYETMENLKPESVNWLVKADHLYYREGNYGLAIKLYEKILAKNPNDEELWNKEANCLYQTGRLNDALDAYGRCIKLNRSNTIAWENRGDIYMMLGDYKAALKSYDELIMLIPRYPEAWRKKGDALIKIGKLEEGQNAYNTAANLKR